jgi:hypothetical protein
VGRTGIRDSAPHLHFGLFHEGKVLDPLDHLSAYVFPPDLTKRGRAELGAPARRTRSGSPARREATKRRRRHSQVVR